MQMVDVQQLRFIVIAEYADIVQTAFSPGDNDLRIVLNDGSMMKIWFSLKVANRYSYHWERRMIDNTIYRHDNAPDFEWRHVSTFPKHFHNGTQENVTQSNISDVPTDAVREFLDFARMLLNPDA